MNTRISRTMICLVSAFAVGFLADRIVADGKTPFVADVQAAQENEGSKHRTCSNRTLRGTYGLKLEGHSPAGPFASVSQITFDGNGKVSGFEIGSLSGQIVERFVSGDYTVNADCRGFIIIPSEIVPGNPHQARGDVVLVDGGKEFFIIDNEAGWVLNGVGKKL